jgi:phosphonate transport system substrate-binding protein
MSGWKTACSILAAAVVATTAGCGTRHGGAGGNSSAPIKVGVIPYDKADTIVAAYTPFANYMAKKTGRPTGQVFVTPEYAGVLQALRADQIDCAYLNPLSYVLAVDQFKNTPEHLIPIGMPYYANSLMYRGDIFVRADSGITSMKDFKGKSFAFADRTSTSGYLYPAGMMKEAGLDPTKDVKAVNISGGGSVAAVFNKLADGGASYDGSIERALKDPAKIKQMKVIAQTDPIPNGMFVARGNLDPKTLAALKQAMIDINNEPDGQAALKAMEFNKWVPADDHAFDSVRQKAKILGLDLKSLDAK